MPNKKSDNQFFSKLYPQSLYRKHSSYTKTDRHISPLDTKLTAIKSLSKAKEEKLKNQIKKLSTHIVSKFMAENRFEEVINDGHLDKIYKKLGIS